MLPSPICHYVEDTKVDTSLLSLIVLYKYLNKLGLLNHQRLSFESGSHFFLSFEPSNILLPFVIIIEAGTGTTKTSQTFDAAVVSLFLK